MSAEEKRQRDILLMTLGIQFSVLVVVIPETFPLIFLSVLIAIFVVWQEGYRQLDKLSR